MNEAKKQKQQEQMELMQHQMARREGIFAEYPDLKKFITCRDKWMRALQLIGLIIYIIRAAVLRSITGASFFSLVLGVIVGYGLLFIVLMTCRVVSVKILNNAALLCVCLFILNIFNLFNNMRKIGASVSIIQIYRDVFQISPMFVIADISTFVFLVLTCIVVLWFVMLPKNKQMLRQFEELSNQ